MALDRGHEGPRRGDARHEGSGEPAPPPPPGSRPPALVERAGDYPTGELLVQVDPLAVPIRVFFPDQHRIWRVSQGPRSWPLATTPADREALAPGAPVPPNQPALQAAWRALLATLDLQAWIDAEDAAGER